MSIFSRTTLSERNAWVTPVSAMCVFLGVLMAGAWVTEKNRQDRFQQIDAIQQNNVGAGSIDVQTAYLKLQGEVTRLRDEKTKLENAAANQSGQAKILNDTLQDLKSFAGLTEVKGPGVVVTLSDSQKASFGGPMQNNIIHDVDVVRVVNELYASGAEAVSVNNHRAGPTTSYRCVGTTILVDGIRIASPVVIRAIGDSPTLYGAMTIPDGSLDQIKQTDPSMVNIEKVNSVTMPAYAGSTERKFAQVVKTEK